MKVTICFGDVRVTVPCGNGEISIADLQEKACVRYRRAINKSATFGVSIIKLENAVDGGILDAEDLVSDVVEDKDKLIAIFKEEAPAPKEWEHDSVISSEGRNSSHHSSANATRLNGSIEQEQRYFSVEKHDPMSVRRNGSRERLLDFEATNQHPHSNSVPVSSYATTTNQSITSNHVRIQNGPSRTSEAGHASASLHRSGKLPTSDQLKPAESNLPKKKKRVPSREQHQSDFHREAPNQQLIGTELPRSPSIEEAFYMSNGAMQSQGSLRPEQDVNAQLGLTMWLYDNSSETRFVNDGNIEAISVREYLAGDENHFVGLLVQSIKQKSRTAQQGPLTCGDIIIGINEHLLLDFGFNDAESLLTQSLSRSHVLFRVLSRAVEGESSSPRTQQSEVSMRSEARSPPITRDSRLSSSSKRISSDSSTSPTRAPLPLSRKSSRDPKKISAQISIQLLKDEQGLGFSLASRESILGEPGPIYVQQILKDGAAMKSGRLLAGDRLLEVNGVSTFGKSQKDVVNQLRTISVGSTVDLVVGRLTENMPRKLKHNDPDSSHVITDDQLKEYFTFDIALNDTGSAGLGISLKGNQNTKTGQDLGVFVRSVFHGGAAWQDGRLRANDQLIKVNGHSLLGLSNQGAIDILRSSMSVEGNVRGMIEMMIARRKTAPEAAATSHLSSDASIDKTDYYNDQQNSASQTAHHLGSNTTNSNVQEDKQLDHSENISSKKHENNTQVDSTDVRNHQSNHADTTNAVKLRKFRNTDVDRVQRSSFRRSLSSESLVAAVENQSNLVNASRDNSKPDVGPCLGIAKSSSLESLQTAVEACIAEQNPDVSLSRPLPKSVRGRVLNDSFRAALNRTYDLSQTLPSLKQMAPDQSNNVHEDGYSPQIRSNKSVEDGQKSSKKRSKFFSLFKTSKTKKQDATPSNAWKSSEKDEHKRNLEARRESDFAKMKDEQERIQTKAREFREMRDEERKKEQKQNRSPDFEPLRSPSVPITTMEKLKEFYMKESSSQLSEDIHSQTFSDHSHENSRNSGRTKDSSQTSNSKKSRKRSKSENRKFKDSTAAYNSLPRQPRRKDKESWNSSSIEVADRSSIHAVDNASFYNRHKPASLDHSTNQTPPLSYFGEIEADHPKSPDKIPGSVYANDRSDSNQRIRNRQHSKTPESRKYSTLQREISPSSVALRKNKKSSDYTKSNTVRHSIYTDQPSAFTQFTSPRSLGASASRKADTISRHTPVDDPMWLRRHNEDSSNSSVESNQTASSSGLGVNERNRRRQLVNNEKQNGTYDKIEMSLPCDL